MPTPHLTPKGQKKVEDAICLFAQTNFRNSMRRFGIKTDDRRRHMYVIGKTGMGKTTMLENMVLYDIYNGNGIGIVDPHGDFAEKIIDFVPSHRINDIVYVNPADVEFPIGFNILEVENEEQKHLVAAGLMAVFKKIWPDVWSSRMEYILNNTLLALLDYPGSTLLGINRMLGDKKYRKRVVSKINDPVIKAFWQNEFASWEDRYRKEAVAPIQNKIGQFLSASVIRNMVAQVKSTINIREAMDTRKILIMNLSKGRIGEDNSRLLGGMLITKIQLAAMERVDQLEKDRQDFFLYVDEFQNFATESFANILSEARKYRLSLIMAHQYIKQLTEEVRDAVFGNVGTIVSFRVGADDAEVLAKEYAPVFLEEDIVNLSKFNVFMKLMIDGVASQPFSAVTMPPIGSPTKNAEKVIRVSRERYAKPRAEIEDKITRWSGMDADLEDPDDDEEGKQEKPVKEKKEKQKEVEQPKEVSDKKEKEPAKERKPDASSEMPKNQESKQFPNEEQKNEKPSEDSADPAPMISLKDLLPGNNAPAESEKEEDRPDHADREQVITNQPRSQDHLASEKKVEKESGKEDNNVQESKGAPEEVQKAGDSPERSDKKKRRRRKRKKKSGNDTGGGGESTSRREVEQSPSAVSQPQSDVTVPPVTKTIQPDEIIRFTE